MALKDLAGNGTYGVIDYLLMSIRASRVEMVLSIYNDNTKSSLLFERRIGIGMGTESPVIAGEDDQKVKGAIDGTMFQDNDGRVFTKRNGKLQPELVCSPTTYQKFFSLEACMNNGANPLAKAYEFIKDTGVYPSAKDA